VLTGKRDLTYQVSMLMFHSLDLLVLTGKRNLTYQDSMYMFHFSVQLVLTGKRKVTLDLKVMSKLVLKLLLTVLLPLGTT
jgi:hypothetical protein